ncbi:uncharacterized protein LOC110458703 [Mizuhopecten yessoensis]|uniref:uncharacterized protein LOC110458703 n=1 Tax=Mizuhopecten yessoensis TaxID=6573 RepID=UPI000B45E0BD|nr:uncharacterized protein LOC110458703 [Mizuhopecten yessoensis]XP_021366243.1 uncharacterized protein LOC110458703 [Mizuhopecten yessoensis]XP_021366244.1 uncharacterized protein LOC110458703 [Mizuhopecten yessoensis]
MESNVNAELKDLHNKMVCNISTEIFGDQLEKVKFLFKDNPLTPFDMFQIKNIETLFERLMNYETIDYGNYQKFVTAISCIHPRVCSIVQRHAEKINKLQGNLDDQARQEVMSANISGISIRQATSISFIRDRQEDMAKLISLIFDRQEDMAKKISDVSTRQEDLATNITDIYNILKDKARDIHNFKGELVPAKNVTTANTSHTKKIHPDLELMIETTKAKIRKEKEKKFYHTKGFCDAKVKLQKNRVVVIMGNTGDGKTAIAVQLLHWLSQEKGVGQPLQLHKIKKLDLLAPNLKLITFIDDIFGEIDVFKKDVQEWNKRVSDVETLFLDEQTVTNFLLITVRNEVFNSLEKRYMGRIFTRDNLIDLSSDTYKVEEEKKILLELYKPENFS